MNCPVTPFAFQGSELELSLNEYKVEKFQTLKLIILMFFPLSINLHNQINACLHFGGVYFPLNDLLHLTINKDYWDKYTGTMNIDTYMILTGNYQILYQSSNFSVSLILLGRQTGKERC